MITTATRHHSWKKINYRRTGTLLAAEFLHGLYQRHDPFLNPFRFANTLVVFRPWMATSFAPEQEWDRLAARFGGRILASPDTMFGELDRVLANPRARSTALAARLETLPVDRLTDEELAELLVETHHVPLGEIYEVNLVQVEHALHAVAKSLIRRDRGDDELLARLVASAVPTVGGESERHFVALVAQARQAGVPDEAELARALDGLAREHEELGSGYGADTLTTEQIGQRFRQYLALSDEEFAQRRAALAEPSRPAAPAVEVAPDLRRVLDFLTRTGEVRDRNKRLLGRITRHRTRLLESVAGRRRAELEALRLYSLEELLRLLGEGVELPDQVLDRRRASGVVFQRAENFALADSADLPHSVLGATDLTRGRAAVVRGTCASPGAHTGTVRIVTSAADLERMSVGDVLVAVGTDFDLLLLLQMAGAIITEEGGLLSHAAVIARELEIPCLIGVTDACTIFADGEQVTVRATEGQVDIHAVAAAPAAAPVDRTEGTTGGGHLLPLTAGMDPHRAGRKATGLAWLASLGVPTPGPAYVLPSEVCGKVADDLAAGSRATAVEVAEDILAALPGRTLSLRSSSLIEDTEEGTAAGIYHSEVGIRPDVASVVEALTVVLGSRTAERAQAYHRRSGRSADAPLAVLVTPYCTFTYQGTAFSHSPWSADHVAVEYFESPGTGGCPSEGGTMVHLRRDALAASDAVTVPHLQATLREVAATTVRIATGLGGPAEVEWGVDADGLTFVQARSVQPGAPGTGGSR
jgi:phosphohistidine swiveling domain-containing protein